MGRVAAAAATRKQLIGRKTMNIEMLLLNKLVPSPVNVRKTDAAQGIEELAASVAADGLLQNL
jgi:ParB-like chromosome segregation protein Spo0J